MRFYRGRDKHGEWGKLLSSYLDGELSSQEKGRFEAHLDTCEQCKEELATLRATVDLLRKVPVVSPPRSFALTRQSFTTTSRSVTMWPALATAAASLLLAVFVVGGLVTSSAQPIPNAAPTAQMEETLDANNGAKSVVPERSGEPAAAPSVSTLEAGTEGSRADQPAAGGLDAWDYATAALGLLVAALASSTAYISLRQQRRRV